MTMTRVGPISCQPPLSAPTGPGQRGGIFFRFRAKSDLEIGGAAFHPRILVQRSWDFEDAAVGATVGNVTEMPLAARIVGVVAVVVLVLVLKGSGPACRLRRQSASPVVKVERGLGYLFECLILIGP